MITYLVERYLPGMSAEEFVAAARRARAATTQMRREGTAIRYLGSTLVPEEDTYFCTFEGASVEAVREANERAGLPYARVLECRHIDSDDFEEVEYERMVGTMPVAATPDASRKDAP